MLSLDTRGTNLSFQLSRNFLFEEKNNNIVVEKLIQANEMLNIFLEKYNYVSK